MKIKNSSHMPIPPELEDLFHPPKYFETYIKFATHRTIFVNEDFTKQMASELTGLLFYYDNESSDTITIYINSDGGDAHALVCVQDAIGMIDSPVSTICLGKAYSAGAYLLASGTKGKRYCLPHSEIMVHQIQCLYPIPNGESSLDSKTYYEFLKTINNGMIKGFAKQTGHSIEEIQQDCERDRYFTANTALDYGIVDAILG